MYRNYLPYIVLMISPTVLNTLHRSSLGWFDKAFLIILDAFTLQVSNSTGVLRLKFLTYNNPNSRLADGSCCEGAVCSNQCDNYFRICLTLPSGNNCGLGYKETSVLGDDSFDFGRSLGGGTRNPLVYHFFSWQVGILAFFLNQQLPTLFLRL